jgi:hypothetical protein
MSDDKILNVWAAEKIATRLILTDGLWGLLLSLKRLFS